MSVNHDHWLNYVRSIKGLCKITCLLCALIGFICIVCTHVRLSNFRGSSYLIVVAIGFVATLTLLLYRCLQRCQFRLCDVPIWSCFAHASLAVSHFIVSGLVLSLDIPTYTAAAVFGLTIFSINGLEAYASFRRSRQRDVATQTVVTRPSAGC